MREEQQVSESLEAAASAAGGFSDNAALVVYDFLSAMIDREQDFFRRQVWRTVRGMVKTFIDKNGGGR